MYLQKRKDGEMDNEQSWIDAYKKKGALWIHDKNPERPHALLASGRHSNGFFNSRPVIADETLLRTAALAMIDSFTLAGGEIDVINIVVGPQTGATKLAEFISDEIGKLRGRPCLWASPAKHGEGLEKKMVFTDEERLVLRGKTVLLCEDVLTTGGSVDLAIDASIDAGGKDLPFVVVLVNRSGATEVRGRKIIALINRSMPMWESNECPVCALGSKAIRPKGPEEWALLNADY